MNAPSLQSGRARTAQAASQPAAAPSHHCHVQGDPDPDTLVGPKECDRNASAPGSYQHYLWKKGLQGSMADGWRCARRAARVVAWLEALEGEALDSEAALMAAGGATAGRFGATEGVWTETRLRLDAGVSRHGDQQLVRAAARSAICRSQSRIMGALMKAGDRKGSRLPGHACLAGESQSRSAFLSIEDLWLGRSSGAAVRPSALDLVRVIHSPHEAPEVHGADPVRLRRVLEPRRGAAGERAGPRRTGAAAAPAAFGEHC